MGNDFFLEICGVRGEIKDSPGCSLRQRPGPPQANGPLLLGTLTSTPPTSPPLLAALTLGATGRRVPAQVLGGLAAPQTNRAAGTGGLRAHTVPHGCLCHRQSHPRRVLLRAVAHCSRGRPIPSGSAPGVCGAQAPAVLWLHTPGSAVNPPCPGGHSADVDGSDPEGAQPRLLTCPCFLVWRIHPAWGWSSRACQGALPTSKPCPSAPWPALPPSPRDCRLVFACGPGTPTQPVTVLGPPPWGSYGSEFPARLALLTVGGRASFPESVLRELAVQVGETTQPGHLGARGRHPLGREQERRVCRKPSPPQDATVTGPRPP